MNYVNKYSFNSFISRTTAHACKYLANIKVSDIEEFFSRVITEPININTFIEWIEEIDFSTKTSPFNYFKNAFFNELKLGTFKQKPKQYIDTTSLLNGLRDNGFEILEWDDVRIDILMNFFYENGILTATEMFDFNHKLIHFIKSRVRKPTSKYFLLNYRKNKTLKEIDFTQWVELDKHIEDKVREWQEKLKI